ncbi:HAMP domain-containing sensor histidine kinase [Tunturiibacter empetritectus]|uniref:histidine kinase n=1 Tax=Tunturiibacter lichenicola TaxID=2051959 RepID=A0A852VDZ1_9BACT|nr:two-component system sensor histidine kinase CpxA [Edaphobacter lichenicola]
MIRSLSTAVALASLCVLVICLFTAFAISQQTEHVYFDPVFHRMDRMELEDARSAFEGRGLPALRAYLQRLDRQFGGKHFLLDGSGRSMDGGEDHSSSLPPIPETNSRGWHNGHFTLTQQSEDRRYWFFVTEENESPGVSFGRFYFLIAGVVFALGAFSTAYIVLPLRRMAAVVESFGMGNMSARIGTKRHDEIGALAKSYDDMADRLEVAFRRERQLLQDVSHELRAPLTRLSFSTELARTAPNQSVAMDEVKRDVDRLSFLVSELTALSLGPPGGANYGLGSSPVDLEGIVLEAVRDCELEAAAKGCPVSCTGSAREMISGEAEHLRRAIGNVLRNAVRHSPEKATVEVTLNQSHAWSSITVRDYGPGVPEELLERIFDPFFQVDPARSASQGGLGLGLCIAMRSVELHRGTIRAENAMPGLRVSINLPTGSPASDNDKWAESRTNEAM